MTESGCVSRVCEMAALWLNGFSPAELRDTMMLLGYDLRHPGCHAEILDEDTVPHRPHCQCQNDD